MKTELETTTIAAGVSEAVAVLKRALERRGVDLFAVIDHAAGAREVGLELDDEVVIILGNPAAGTRVMQESRLAGLDLPLRMLIWREDEVTHVAYSDPHTLADRFDLETSRPVLDAMATLLSGLVEELRDISAPADS